MVKLDSIGVDVHGHDINANGIHLNMTRLQGMFAVKIQTRHMKYYLSLSKICLVSTTLLY